MSKIIPEGTIVTIKKSNDDIWDSGMDCLQGMVGVAFSANQNFVDGKHVYQVLFTKEELKKISRPLCFFERKSGLYETGYYFSILNFEEFADKIEEYENSFVCDLCGEKSYGEGKITVDGKHICFGCFRDENYYICEHCGLVTQEPLRGPRDGFYCSAECMDIADPLDTKYFLNYSYKPAPRFLGEGLHFGVELEVDREDGEGNGKDLVYELGSNFKNVYCKYDSSLSEAGVEIITQPASIEYHKKEMKWPEIIKTIEDFGYDSDFEGSTCGLHFHVDKKFFGKHEEQKEAAIKIVMFLRKNYSHMLKFTRRTKREIDRWAFFPNFSATLKNSKKQKEIFYDRMLEDRHMALNILNSNTFEFRIFKGSIDFDVLLASMEMVQVLCEFVKNKSFAAVRKATWESVFKNSRYEELNKYNEKIFGWSEEIVA